MIIGGFSLFRFWLIGLKCIEIADSVGLTYLFDMAHVAGMIAAGIHQTQYHMLTL